MIQSQIFQEALALGYSGIATNAPYKFRQAVDLSLHGLLLGDIPQ